MPDIKQVFSEEIRRLARKEIKLATKSLTDAVAMLRHQLSEQKKSLKALEKQFSVLPGKTPFASSPCAKKTAEKVGKLRLNAKGIVRIRKKLKLTQETFAALIGVAPHTVSLWEQEKTSPRPAQKNKICALRTAGKRELKKQLAEIAAAKKAPAVQE